MFALPLSFVMLFSSFRRFLPLNQWYSGIETRLKLARQIRVSQTSEGSLFRFPEE
jgi:hypothetical protein